MKIVLTILCGLMVLFAGGCAIVLFGGSAFSMMPATAGFAAIPGGIAALNVLVLLAIWGKKKPQAWAFHVLAILDGLLAAGATVVWTSEGFDDPPTNAFAAAFIGASAVKGILTFVYGRATPEPQQPKES
jgi:hypothetical protein